MGLGATCAEIVKKFFLNKKAFGLRSEWEKEAPCDNLRKSESGRETAKQRLGWDQPCSV